jgi:hypothetical protein
MGLERAEIMHTLFLAVPIHAYEGIFSEVFGQLVMEYFRLNLLVFPIDGLGGLQWIAR